MKEMRDCNEEIELMHPIQSATASMYLRANFNKDIYRSLLYEQIKVNYDQRDT